MRWPVLLFAALGACGERPEPSVELVRVEGLPAVVRSGEAYGLTVTLRNNGDLPLGPRGVETLLVAKNMPASLWGLRPVAFPRTIEPGEQVTLHFNVRAPDEPAPLLATLFANEIDRDAHGPFADKTKVKGQPLLVLAPSFEKPTPISE